MGLKKTNLLGRRACSLVGMGQDSVLRQWRRRGWEEETETHHGHPLSPPLCLTEAAHDHIQPQTHPATYLKVHGGGLLCAIRVHTATAPHSLRLKSLHCKFMKQSNIVFNISIFILFILDSVSIHIFFLATFSTSGSIIFLSYLINIYMLKSNKTQ